jgi:TusA-related sulfurtransferase
MSELIDVRGLACPQPAMLVADRLKAMEKGGLEVLVSSPTALEAVVRQARARGWEMAVERRDEGAYLVRLSRA